MNELQAHFSIEILLLLTAIAASVAVVVKRINLPYTVALVLAGLGLSFFQVLPSIHLTEDLVMFVFLPPLLFEAAWNLQIRYLRQNWAPIGLMAVLGLLLSIAFIGCSLHGLLGIPLTIALLFGAMISATDPVSVIAIFKKMNLDHRLSTIVEGESLFNDGTAVVMFKILLAIVLMGTAMKPDGLGEIVTGGLFQFLLVVAGGIGIGWIVGLVFSNLTSKFEDPMLELTFTAIVAYGSFILADLVVVPGVVPGLHLSGVIATVTASLVLGRLGRHSGMSASTRLVVSSFWEFAAFFVNSLIFLMIGLEIQIGFLLSQWQAILVSVLMVILARAVSVYILVPMTNLKGSSPIPRSWQHVLVWGGLRGALSMALALSLPISFPERQTLIAMVFGVVLFSLVGQGLSMASLLNRLGLHSSHPDGFLKYNRLKAIRVALKGALQELDGMRHSGEVIPSVSTKLEKEMIQELSLLDKEIEELRLIHDEWELEEYAKAQVHLLTVRKDILTGLVKNGILSEETGDILRLELDEALENMHQLPKIQEEAPSSLPGTPPEVDIKS